MSIIFWRTPHALANTDDHEHRLVAAHIVGWTIFESTLPGIQPTLGIYTANGGTWYVPAEETQSVLAQLKEQLA